jgi:hypothetical protein
VIDFPVPPARPGWYGVICFAGGGKTTKVPAYFDGQQWRDHPMFPWVRSALRFETADEAQAWLDCLPD